jgi:hypothetical protein
MKSPCPGRFGYPCNVLFTDATANHDLYIIPCSIHQFEDEFNTINSLVFMV